MYRRDFKTTIYAALILMLAVGMTCADTIFEAAARGHLDVLKAMVKGSPSLITSTDGDGATPLHYAAATGRCAVGEYLLANGASVNARKKDGVTPLHVAAALGQKDMTEFLIRKRADVNSVDGKGRTPLTLARSRNHPIVARLLVAAGAGQPAVAKTPAVTPVPAIPDQKFTKAAMDPATAGLVLWTAASKGDLARVRSILDSVSTPDLANYETQDYRMTPLQAAAAYGHKDMAAFLIARGADINHKDSSGDTPLHMAAFHGQLPLVELLLAKDADMNARDNDGETPLSMAAGAGRKDVLALLITKGAPVDSKNKDGLTPLHKAASNGHLAATRLLMTKGADLNAKDNAGRSPLNLAQDRKHPAVAELLSTSVPVDDAVILPAPAPAKPAATPAKSKAPAKPSTTRKAPSDAEVVEFFEAVTNGDSKRVKELVSYRSNPELINARDKEGMAPLHWAAFNGKSDILTLLLARGADANVKTASRWNVYRHGLSVTFNAGTTPLQIAQKLGHKTAIDILKMHAAK